MSRKKNIKREVALEFIPVLGFGIKREKFRKPEFTVNLTIWKIYLPFLMWTIGYRELNELKMTRQQRRILEWNVKSRIGVRP